MSVFGRVIRVSGPLVVADKMSGAGLYEVVLVGDSKLMAEIIKLSGGTAFIQCYEETAGLTIGDPVSSTGAPLRVELGPGLLDCIFDGLLRPLRARDPSHSASLSERSASASSSSASSSSASASASASTSAVSDSDSHSDSNLHFMPTRRGEFKTALELDHTKLWPFQPSAEIKVMDVVEGGDVFGCVQENRFLKNHLIIVPPYVSGRVRSIKPAGEYTLDDTIMVIEDLSNPQLTVDLRLSHYWPVRNSRPVHEKFPSICPLLTGLRVLDALFPIMQGSTCAIAGAFGCGKTVISQAIAKQASSQCVVYVGCGERGNDIAEMLTEFPKLFTRVDGEDVPIMQRTCLVANTSNMPVASREASIYTGITVAEYFRDMGLDVVMMADSTSRWAEALRDISALLGEPSDDGGYPACVGTRLAQFYHRAGHARCLGKPNREGSVTIVGTVSPPGGDFADHITRFTSYIVHSFWSLERKLAQKKHFPSVNWHASFSKEGERNSRLFSVDPDFEKHIAACRQILRDERQLQEVVQLVGKDPLPEDLKVSLEVAKLIREEYLQQNVFSPYDYTCPRVKSAGMIKNLIRFYDLANKAVRSKRDVPITWAAIARVLRKEYFALTDMKFIIPTIDEKEIKSKLDAQHEQLEKAFRVFDS